MDNTTTAYTRNADGTLDARTVECYEGTLYCGESELTRKGTDTAELLGWGCDGDALVYETDGGVEVLIPTSWINSL